ncbi:MAG: glycosyltransferase family 2 protein [Candidatus Aenigmatarchaeota archaeon]
MRSYSEAVVLIPAYNEEKNIEKVVKLTKKYVKGAKVVVVDDGSKDKTSKLAKKAGATVIVHKKNKGKGEALNTGFSFILKKLKSIKYVVLIDADLQFHPRDAKSVMAPLIADEADFVMGNRDWSKVPLRHRLGNILWRITFNLLFGTRLKDTNCGMISMNKKALKAVGRVYGGYIIDNQLIINCLKRGLKVTNAPVTVYYKHVSKVPRGVRMVLGVWVFLVKKGIRYRLGLEKA